MVDKKPTKVKPINKPKESKSDYFIRIAKPRVKSVLKALRILGNCSKRNNYAYDEKQVNHIKTTIQESLDTMISTFTKSKKEQENFEF